ncbi:MAG: hypothetical protein JXR36_02265, partial [Bacteroidales bacterium]|nr:hypothetical protein [Bacteroidales bacterium]
MKKAILVFAFLFLILGTYYAQAKQLSINSEKGLLVALKSASLTNAFDIAVKKARPFEINPEILKSDRVAIGDSLMLNLFAGKEYLSVTQS